MITGRIFHQYLELVDSYIVADTIDYLEVRFCFCTEDWDGMTKWAHFSRKDSVEVYDICLTDGCIRREDHLNLSGGKWSVYLHGNRYADGEVVERVTTNEVTLTVHHTGILDGEPFPTIPPSAGEQIVARATAAAEDAASSADNAREAAKEAASAKTAAESAADRAEQAMLASGFAEFEIGSDGCLYLGRTTNITEQLDFRLTDAGELEAAIGGNFEYVKRITADH